jgi:HPt (histidine-containing phosphotransfer) domain-containing protein
MWSDAPVLDPDALARLHRLGGAGFVAELLRLFDEQGTARVGEITNAAMADDLETARRSAHSLVSTAGNLGARRLQGLAAAIERAAASHDWAAVSSLVPTLAPAFDAAREALTSRHAESPS